MKFWKTVKVSAFVFTLGLLCVNAFSQDTGAINGQIIDPSNSAVPNVAVQAVNQDTGVTRKAVANPEGVFFIGTLPPGRYELSAQVPGFKNFRRTGIPVSVEP